MTDREDEITQLRAQGLDVTEWHDAPGTDYAEHAHPSREVRVILAGSITFVIDGMTRELRTGDRIELLPMQSHSAHVGRDGVHYIAGSDRGTGR